MSLANIKIEKIVLGAMMQDEKAYWDTSEILNTLCFSTDDHQKIYSAINDLALSGKAIRTHILAGRVTGLTDGMEPEAYFAALLHAATQETDIPLQDFSYELRDLATKRRLKEVAEGIIKATDQGGHDANMILDRASERLADLAKDSSSEHETTLAATVRQIVHQSGVNSRPGMTPCLVGLEEMVGSFMPGSLVLWGSVPGGAKTAIAMQQALHSSALDPVTFFELEMDNRSVVARSIAGHTGISARQIMRGMSEMQIERVMEMESQWASRNLSLVCPPQMTIQQLRSRALHHKRTRGIRMLIVDHIKLVTRPSKYRMPDHERAYENGRDLKALAKELECCVIALCQFTKSARQKEDPEPDMEDFYGGSLEEHADVMLANLNRWDWLKRNPPRTSAGKAKEKWDEDCRMAQDRIEIFKLKDRFGKPRDRKIFHWNGARTLFTDLDGAQPELINGGGMPAFEGFDFDKLERPHA